MSRPVADCVEPGFRGLTLKMAALSEARHLFLNFSRSPSSARLYPADGTFHRSGHAATRSAKVIHRSTLAPYGLHHRARQLGEMNSAVSSGTAWPTSPRPAPTGPAAGRLGRKTGPAREEEGLSLIRP